MRHTVSALIAAGAIVAGALLPFAISHADLGSQHEVPAIRDALATPIPAEAQRKAREFDDQLLQEGQTSGEAFYLVHDDRAERVERIAGRLLEAMGRDADEWVVRVLDTQPKRINAFVAGGRYIYVLTGLIEQAASDDELAFVVGHELGHTLLQHHLRAEADTTDTVVDVAALVALLSEEHRAEASAFGRALRADYSRIDEAEADALGVAIAERAGYNAGDGVRFFARSARARDQQTQQHEQTLEQAKEAAMTARARYRGALNEWERNPDVRTQQNKALLDKLYRDAERKRQHYNQMLQRSQQAQAQRQVQKVFSGHPSPQNRTAAVSAALDYLAGRRDLASLAEYEQTQRVYRALEQLGSPLVDSTP